MDLQTDQLDTDELLHLAIQASKMQRQDQAITYLKQAVQKNPENADVLYMLAAEHAQIGLYERAAEEMTQALALNPDLHTARFQLGLLYLSSGKAEPALATLQPLTQLKQDDFFYCFSQGLVHLIRDEFADCKRLLEEGIELNKVNPALNQDMMKILDAIKDQTLSAALPVTESSAGKSNVWLSAYQNEDDDTQH